MPFLMIRNDITKVAADAIVNPANRNLLQGSGTSRAIYQAAGEQELTAACEAISHCDMGKAGCTPAFDLPAKYIFHAVCPAWHGGGVGEAEQLAGAYHSALELAAEYHCESVAFPLLSSGNYGYPKEQAFRIAVDTITQYVMEHDLTVYLVLYDRDSLAVSRKLFTSVEEYIDDHYVAQNDESYQFDRRRREWTERRRRLEEDVALPPPAPAAVPRAARSLESTGFEDALRNAVSLGGDSDTLACITGGMAEAFYGMPQELREETLKRLPEDIREAYELFRKNALDRKVSAD